MPDFSPVTEGLVTIHKLITRALDVSISKCDEYIKNRAIPANEEKGFALYVTTLIRVMHAHHLGEDDVVFPYFKERIEAPYIRLKDDHVTMANLLDNLEKGIGEITIFDIGRIKNILSDLRKSWGPHITAEESSFSAKVLSGTYTEKEQRDLLDKIGQHGSKLSGPAPVTIPFVIYNLEPQDRKIFLKDFPWIMKVFFIPLLWRSKWKPMDPFLLN
ncbi:MAG TPA: hemerythrin domain-containing protein [Bacteroidales bacterium]|nr:hemerythrin domain-containing protein [Bacteroidales bacterium]